MRRKVTNIILLNVLVFFALISIHEIAHLGAGYLMGCVQGKAVLLDSFMKGPYTEMVCASNLNQVLMHLSGLLMTSCFGLLFLSMKYSGKSMFSIVMGLSIVFSSLDLSLAVANAVFYPVIAFGFASIAAGEYFIAHNYIREENPLDIFGIK